MISPAFTRAPFESVLTYAQRVYDEFSVQALDRMTAPTVQALDRVASPASKGDA